MIMQMIVIVLVMRVIIVMMMMVVDVVVVVKMAMIMVVMMIPLVMMMIQYYISSNGFSECKQSINAKVNAFRAKYLFNTSLTLFITICNHLVPGEGFQQCRNILEKNIA